MFFGRQKTGYEMRMRDWSADVCSSDLGRQPRADEADHERARGTAALDDARLAGFGTFVPQLEQIGRASCRERVCQYVSISVVAVTLKKTIVNYEVPTRHGQETPR